MLIIDKQINSNLINNLVLGGAGFLGSHLIDKLLTKGENVLCIDNFFTGKNQNIKHLKGNKKFYDNDFEGTIKSLNNAFRLGCNDRYAFWKRGIAKSKLGDQKGAHNDMVQFGFHLESDYMIQLLNEKMRQEEKIALNNIGR